jgi:hypothetical protein
VPFIPPPPTPSASASASASAAPSGNPVGVGAPTDKPGTKAPARPAKPKDQVGSAGISSQF